jgi:hypothetical protein
VRGVGLTAYPLFAPLLFPDGRLPADRPWRILLAEVAVLTAVVIGLLLEIDPMVAVLQIVALVLVVVSVASLVIRYRRSRGLERLQIAG